MDRNRFSKEGLNVRDDLTQRLELSLIGPENATHQKKKPPKAKHDWLIGQSGGVLLSSSRNLDGFRQEAPSSEFGNQFEGSSYAQQNILRGSNVEHHNPSLEFSLGRPDWQSKERD
ncbi:hypothetical protein REPUB_Repub07fG0088900 [Reevesia pubescens]